MWFYNRPPRTSFRTATITNSRKYFGTDGIRGRVGEEPITPDFIMKLGWAVGRIADRDNRGPVLVGKDTRISGYMFESALEAGLSAAGVDIRLLGPMPTPAIAYLTKNTRARAGIVISASHNPYYDNGIKIFSADGRKLPDEMELQIEREMEKPFRVIESGKLGKARRITDAPRRYIEFCKSRVECDLAGLYIIVDCANGAAYKIAPRVYEEMGARVEVIGADPDGFNINEGYGATCTERLQLDVRNRQADLGIALDGDGDRLILTDSSGKVIDGDEILYILAAHYRDRHSGIVGTHMSNLGLELAVRDMGLEFFRANVGDRYVMDMLAEKSLTLGGESSGHIINLEKTDTGDGIITALQVLQIMVETGKSLAELLHGMEKLPQKLHNIPLPAEFREDDEGIRKAIADTEQKLGKRGRVLLRPSGTEPLLRIMVEGENENLVNHLIGELTSRVQAVITG